MSEQRFSLGYFVEFSFFLNTVNILNLNVKAKSDQRRTSFVVYIQKDLQIDSGMHKYSKVDTI